MLHGSDAHEQRTVGVPDGRRYSWVKGILAFDTLRHACIDPAGRAFVGEEAPISTVASQTIARIEFQDAPWARTPTVELNPGLVVIVGGRGSGKTALADAIALACDAISDRLSPRFFLTRAQDLLHGASVCLKWQTGEQDERRLDRADVSSSAAYPRARYLSQHFVEELCAADGMTDELLREIERVIFEAHPLSNRDGAVDFDELLDMRATRFREARVREEESLAEISERIGTDLEKDKLVTTVKRQIVEKTKLIEAYINVQSWLRKAARVESSGLASSPRRRKRSAGICAFSRRRSKRFFP